MAVINSITPMNTHTMAVTTRINVGTTTTLLVCVLVFIGSTISVCNAQVAAAAAPAVYIFGDSLMDVGNNNYLPLSIAKADFPHNGVDFPTGEPTGRFSNGWNAADFLAKKIGLPTPPPYLSLIGGVAPPITGVSFASGGAGILNETGGLLFKQSIALAQQVEHFTMVHDKLVHQLGPSNAHIHLSRSIFPIVIGSNDLFAYFNLGSTVANQYTRQQYVDRMVSSFKGLLEALYGLGARKLVVAGVGAIGCCPVRRKANRTGECEVEINYWSTKYNDGLKMMLQGLKSESLGMNYAYFDTYGAMINLFQNHETYGFREIKEACCGLGNLNADVACIPLATYCANRNDHVFWDLYHPTEVVASLFSDILYSGSRQLMVPMNVEQLLTIIKASWLYRSIVTILVLANMVVSTSKSSLPEPDYHSRTESPISGKKKTAPPILLLKEVVSTSKSSLPEHDCHSRTESPISGKKKTAPPILLLKEEKESDSPALGDVKSDIIPSASVLKQLAIGVETTKVIKSIKDLMILSRDSSAVKDRSGLSLSAMKSFVVGEKEDKFVAEFGHDKKVMSFIHLLMDPEGHHSRRKAKSRLDTTTIATKFSKELHGAPPESFVPELAEAIGSLKTLKKMALFWSRVVLELRRLWCEGKHIPGIPPDEIPNLNSCLLHQQLQVINCCISRKRRRAIATESLDSVLKQANNKSVLPPPSGDILPESHLMYARISTGELVLRLGADKRLENTTLLDTGEPVYTPVMQEWPLLTEDIIKETEEFVLRTGSVGAGCSQLLSDMQAFKAANPGCILEDFVRWHSPPDWTDDESKEIIDGGMSPSRGHLSTRMQKEGNLWRELWETAKPIPAVRQSPLYYEDLSVEGILHGLENISPSGLFEQLFLSLLSSGCAIAEARISSNEILYKMFKECKDYIVLICQSKSWVEKAQDICQVYETMAVMALNPNKVIRLMNPPPDESTTKEKLWKTPSRNQENNTTTAQFSTMFSKKQPKPASISC
ncbi:hypothetical protein SSX86_024436 [Deinandra increscens subsp. villosa]|uniref:Rab3GAP catalytic subunit conserved domain-containing protein n=1 Tax=Deinandra increscens subsp. villosa TaxID=3103831 RepID=A0AAP0CPM4_9ASTR